MNKRLYNNIMLNISQIVKLKLNEDLLSDLEDDDDNDDSDFISNDKNVVKIFYGKPDAAFMNKYNNVGDLLTYYLKDLFYVIKNDKAIDELKDTLYGKPIAMCVGNGLWVSTEFDYYEFYSWANEHTDLYYTDLFVGSKDNGLVNTTHIFDKYIHKKDVKDTLWILLYDQEISGLGKHICYLPSKNQLKEIFKNNHIIQLPEEYYWSSSVPYAGDIYANNINFGDGLTYYAPKDNGYCCVALINFE